MSEIIYRPIYRPMEERDLPQVMKIERESFSMPWSEESMRKELNENAQIARYMVACLGDRVVGYAGYWQTFDEANITNVAVDADFRHQGIGGGMLDALESEFPQRGIMYATLEVRVSNMPARSLYLKKGFVEAGIRPKFYEKPQEDACIMWKKY